MNKLFSKRLASHLREMFKYLRLVFNDHFIFALLIMIGGLGYAYSNLLKTLHPNVWWSQPIIILVMFALLQIGRLATLLEDADVVFLLPKEHAMHTYFLAAKRYSETLAQICQLFGLFVLLPFIQATDPLSVAALAGLAVTQVILKDTWLTAVLMNHYRFSQRWLHQAVWFRWLVPAIVLIIGVYVTPLASVILALAADGIMRLLGQGWQRQAFDWRSAIGQENNRMLGVYRFFNLFTNVPMLKGVAKRRKYMDGILRLVATKPANTYLYLYSRGMVRSGEFSGLYSRLTIIGMILLYFIHGTWLPVLLAALFLYLIGFQLIPFYWQFDDIVFTHLYPIKTAQRIANFKRLLRTLMIVTGVLFLVIVAISDFQLEVVVITAIVEIVEILAMVSYYLPLRLRKNR
ncbi:ABC transporter permease [Secundilactobacillus paracollinoides]|uniref:ABC transporter permease n=1 Tax=Secundilactobacillus paracollinoides TaxID=240427 RepID=A0A1B2J1I7_9LACO|nr:ABC transporter permease [Secundilactobacillus paracollinoides]ANZ62210.1 ABC transporter permease [Secundilactobacillus paracollinoides]ANZ63899.1 ABC transporter permease [Secundilactobacillus paracollinoides]ANZ68157.1 ABC transporter permease [Secundilactobacillus paracollinoides]